MAFLGTRRKRIASAVGVVIVIGAIAAYAAMAGKDSKDKSETPATLEFLASQVVQPQARKMSYDLVLPGTVQATSQATVRSKLAAVIRRIDVREGDSVEAGQVIAEFDTASLKAQLAEREAGVASAKAQMDQAQRTREANAQLIRQNFITQNAYDAADATYQAQVGSVAGAQAQLAQVQLQLDDGVVRAPISGLIAHRYVQPGEKLGIDSQIVSIVSLSHLEVQAQAAVSDVARVAPGTPAEVVIEGLSDQHIKGRVDRINPSADPGSRTIDLYVAFPNERNIVRTGMFANVRLHLASDRETTTLPITAVQSDANQMLVWAVRDGHLARHVVSVGRRDEQSQLVEILGGVDSNEAVLATRFDNLKAGAPARVVSAGAADRGKLGTPGVASVQPATANP
jgi:RND family efflux transporter MFP subunit